MIVADTAEYLFSLWPNELSGVRVAVADLPAQELPETSAQRWSVDRPASQITLFRLPVQRSTLVKGLDDLHTQMVIEYTVFLAFAEYLGKEPWELAPDRYRPFP